MNQNVLYLSYTFKSSNRGFTSEHLKAKAASARSCRNNIEAQRGAQQCLINTRWTYTAVGPGSEHLLDPTLS